MTINWVAWLVIRKHRKLDAGPAPTDGGAPSDGGQPAGDVSPPIDSGPVDTGPPPDAGPRPEEDPLATAVDGLALVVELGAGSQAKHHCVRLQDSSVWCWGQGGQHQLGRGYSLSTPIVAAIDLAAQADGLLPENAAFSCKALRDSRLEDLDDTLYFLDTDGPGGGEPAAAHCDMNSAGGGWTLAVKVNGALALNSMFRYHNPLWSNEEIYQPEEAGVRTTGEHKNYAFMHLGFDELMVGLAEPDGQGGFGEIRTVFSGLAERNLLTLFAGGTRGFVSYAEWRTLIPDPGYFQNYRPGAGVNAVACMSASVWNTTPTALARVGWIGSGSYQGYCNGVASIIGIGLGGDVDPPRFEFSAGLRAASRNQPTIDKHSMGYLFVR